MKNTKKFYLKGTKAETLEILSKLGYPVPLVFFFTAKDWKTNKRTVVNKIRQKYEECNLIAVRSSAISEDTSIESMAGAFDSVLNVDLHSDSILFAAIEKVLVSFDANENNQVLVQPMISKTRMSGVVMTRVHDDGSPYYVVNFDDSTGKTDTVTSGSGVNKTVFIYNGVKEKDFDSPLLLMVLKLVWQLEKTYDNLPLDIEFAIDNNNKIHLLQVRNITTSALWKQKANELVSERISYLAEYVEKLIQPRVNLHGKKTLLGIMPDWNPAEMIGVVPHPLAMSLYRELITKSAWRLAREKMNYRKMPSVELMVSLFGRCFIDVRNSMNSFLPAGINDSVAERLINAYINRLELNPHLHDKIEFEIVLTAYDFQFDDKFTERYDGLLEKEEYLHFKGLMRSLTRSAVQNSFNSSLNIAISDIEKLKKLQKYSARKLDDPFALSDRINSLLNECIEYGTIPFSILARHGFIAESLLRSAVGRGAITAERIALFKKSIKTVAGEMSEDFYDVCMKKLSKTDFLKNYGHLRPSTYDILSPCYTNRKDLFDGIPVKPIETPVFNLTSVEKKKLNILLAEHGFDEVNADDLMLYAKKAIVGREYAKFIFTKHLSEILELIAKWGKLLGFARSEMSMLTLNEILSVLFAPLTNDVKKYFVERIKKAEHNYSVASSFKLSYLIRSTRDIYVVPQQRSSANFIGKKRIEASIFLLTPYTEKIPDLQNKIVCIEGADPGYDWIFSRNIAGLITKYGGANSHMAIRCAEYDLPAAIGCGEQPFERVIRAGKCLLDCHGKRLEPVSLINN